MEGTGYIAMGANADDKLQVHQCKWMNKYQKATIFIHADNSYI